MKLYPWNDVLDNADYHITSKSEVSQQWNCEHCGAKQTMENPNVFHMQGICEECKKLTDIKKNGHNFMVVKKFRA